MMKRRELLKGLAAASVVAATSRAARSAETDAVEFLLVQNAEGVSLEGGTLRLKSVGGDTLYFSDRPDRIVGRLATKDYVAHWAVGNNNFSSDPPNAVVSILDHAEARDIVVVLRNPRLEGADLVYDVDVLDGDKAATGGASSLFIDIIGRPATPLSVRGAERRAVRRAVVYR